MSSSSAIENTARPPVRVRVETAPGETFERVFTERFQIGREAPDLKITSGLVSRLHAEVVFEAGQWWLCDLNSTNGIYIAGQRETRIALKDGLEAVLGKNGPQIQFHIPPVAPSLRSPEPPPAARPMPLSHPKLPEMVPPSPIPEAKGESTYVEQDKSARDATPVSSPRSPEDSFLGGDPSVTQIFQRYFDADTKRPMGERTQRIRDAYVRAQRMHRRRYYWIIGGVVALFLVAAGYAGLQRIQNRRLEAAAGGIFAQIKEQDLTMAQLRNVVEESGSASLEAQLGGIQQRRDRLAAQYDGYIKELGLYRKLTEEEQLIFRVARIFNESEFGMPAGFVREVRRVIREHWQGPGRLTFVTAVDRATANGYTPVIVRTMQEYGLPPEFFYLAMQESVMNVDAVGPATRWGIAKGMWQFIPSTARRYGLRIGPREDTRVPDSDDDRHNFARATDAAAQYLLDIYSTPAQASGLLVIASYNWGEHRVINKLEELPGPQAIPEEAFEGIPLDPSERTYWRFLNEYSERMPEETKDYVLKIFAAAVIGQNPRLFGFDFDNPLKPYMERPEAFSANEPGSPQP